MSRIPSLLLVALFAAFIGAPAIAWALGVKGGGTELQNRTLAKRPPLTFAKVWDASFGTELTDFVWDAIPLRDKALTMNHKIDFYGFHDSPSKDAFFGLNGFNWRRERVLEGVRAGGGEIKDVKRALDRIERAFQEAGVPLHIVLSPTKASIYPEFLPPRYRVEYEKIGRPVENYYRTRAKTDPVIIDLWGPILAEKQRLLAVPEFAQPELRYLWRRNCDHWNVEAGHVQAREIVRAIDPTLWKEENSPTLDGKFIWRESELSILYFKLGIEEPYQGLTESPRVSIKWQRERVRDSKDPIVTTTTETTETNTPRHEHLLVLRDSMLAEYPGEPSVTRDGGFQTIAPFFDHVTFMHWDAWQKTRKQQADRMKQIDSVVLQVTQGSNYYLVRRAGELVEMARMIGAKRAPFIGPLPKPEP